VTPKLIALIVAAVLYLVIVAQNTEVVSVRLFFWDFSMARVILMTLMALFGFVIGYVVARLAHTGEKKKL
jgi:uncharacterized integral membrane protein